jgi:AcrR family transcriptional regulator
MAKRAEWRDGVRAHRSEVEDQITTATAQRLGSRRVDEVTIEDVMESTGLSRTAFYRYFPSIDRVIARLLGDIVVEVDEGAAWRASDLEADFYVLFEHQGVSLAKIYARHGAIIAALSDATETNPEVHAMWALTLEHRIELVTDRLREFQGNGLAREGFDAGIVGAALTLMAHHLLIHLYRRRSEVPPELVGRTIAELWFRAVFDGPIPERSVD